jgi:hypothetical protein
MFSFERGFASAGTGQEYGKRPGDLVAVWIVMVNAS